MFLFQKMCLREHELGYKPTQGTLYQYMSGSSRSEVSILGTMFLGTNTAT
jgi:hypothetical protein